MGQQGIAKPAKLRHLTASSGFVVGSPPSSACPKHLNKELHRMHPRQLDSESLLNEQVPHPISKAEPRQPWEESHFHYFYPRSHSFGHYPQCLALVEG